MTDSPERPSETTAPVAQPAAPPPPAKPSRINQIAAWVGIAAGVVFVVAVIFGTGFVVGKHCGDGGFGHGHHGPARGAVMFDRGGPPRFPMGPHARQPGPTFPGGPEFELPQRPQRSEAPATTAPSRP